MNHEEFAALLVFATAMSFTPGPNTMLAASLGANLGLRPAMRFVVAVPAGWTLMMLASGLGLGALVVAVPGLRGGLKAVGIVYLVWLAWRLAGVSVLATGSAAPLRVGFWQGVGLQFVNVKAWMLALALAAGWVTGADGQVAANTTERLAIVCAVMATFALTSNSVYALVGSLLRGWLEQGRRLLWFNRTMAVLLLATAAWMIGA